MPPLAALLNGNGSLQRRLNLGLSLTLGLLLLLLWAVAAGLTQRLATELIVARLAHDAEGLLLALHPSPEGAWQLDPAGLPPIYRQPLSGHYYLIHTPRGALRSRSLWDAELEVAPLSLGEQARHEAAGPGDETLLVWSAGFEKGGVALTIALAESLEPAAARMRRFHLAFGGLILCIVAVSLIIQRRVVRSALAGLEALRRELADLEQGRVRALTASAPQEVRPLVEEVNRLLGLLAARLERSRNALGDLAHALKGPLSLIRHTLESKEPADAASLRADLLPRTEQLRGLIERQLKRARLAGDVAPGRRFDAAAELPVLAELLQRMHPGPQIHLHLPAAAQLPADRDDMLELFGNLLDNACKWARSEVHCALENDSEGWGLRIEDDGPGCDPGQLERLTRRGVRLDETRDGHGLGLAIVADLVEVYGGELRCGRSKMGGLRVEVSWRSSRVGSAR
jgi:signal transduction histidine kinase